MGILVQANLKHITGLPLAENTSCIINVREAEYEFVANGLKFSLEISKITDVSIRTDVEITKQAVSSVGGAVAGGVLFGPVGAAVGGAVRTHDVRSSLYYLVITYLSNNEVKYICFFAGRDYYTEIGAKEILNNYNVNKVITKK